MLSLETIMKDSLWVGKFYEGGRITGTYDELKSMKDEFRDFDLLYHQPEHLQEFYKGYFNQKVYYTIPDYYNLVYANPSPANMYEVSFIKNGVTQANIYIASDPYVVEANFLASRSDCELVGIRDTTYAKPGQPIINLTRGNN